MYIYYEYTAPDTIMISVVTLLIPHMLIFAMGQIIKGAM